MIPAERDEPRYRDLRHSVIDGRGHSSVDSILRRRYVRIHRQDRLIEAVEPELRFVDPSGTDREDPVRAQYLRPRHGLRLPLRPQHRNIALGLHAVANEISSRDRIPLVQRVVELDQSVVLPVAIWKRSEEHTSELQSRFDLVCRLLLEKKK